MSYDDDYRQTLNPAGVAAIPAATSSYPPPPPGIRADPDPIISAAVTVGPGDTLVIGFGRPVRPAEADRVRKTLRDQLPGMGVFLIDNVTAFAVVKAAAVLAEGASDAA